nr:hypothetical protein GCM10020063_082240 [Dactylosporangium thailandense]
MNPRLFEVLHKAGLSPSAEDVADALWLAQWIGVPTTSTEPPYSGPSMTATPSVQVRPREGTGSMPKGSTSVQQPPPLGEASRAASATLYSSDTDSARSGDVGEAPAVTLVRGIGVGPIIGARDLARALRPLRRGTFVIDDRPVLDELRTAEASARASAPSPIWRRQSGRWPILVLLIDSAPSMAVWQRTNSALRSSLARLGAFRRVHMRDFDGEDPATLRHLTNLSASVVIVFSDGVGRAWRDGTAQSLLRRLATRAYVTIINPLRPQIWRRTGTPTDRARIRGSVGVLANTAWHIAGEGASGRVPIPVLHPSTRFLATWARIIAGETSWFTLPLLMPPSLPATPSPMSAGERLRQFRAVASPTAFRLASLLSATPLSLPMMQLVQRAHLPSSTESDLAEVLLSGLVEETEHGYDFIPGIRPLLLKYLTRTKALQTLDIAFTYYVPVGGLDVRALLDGDPVPTSLLPLARVTAALLRVMGGPNSVLAERTIRAAADATAGRAEAGALALNEDESDSDLPIFTSARSAWFTDWDSDTNTTPVISWASDNDIAWRAAEQVAERAARPQIVDESTGLPRRVPQQNLIPGSAGPLAERPLRIVRDAAQIAANTTAYFRGWRRGREVGGFSIGGRPGRESAGGWDFRR